MNLYVLLFLTPFLTTTPLDSRGVTPDSVVFEAVLVDVAQRECPVSSRGRAGHKFLSDLLRIEIDAGVPEKYRGMVLAAACSESRYNPHALGDWKRVRGNTKEAMAVGILQLWPWWERKYQVDRRDPYDSADAWVGQIMKTLSRARHKCGKRRAFVSAWAWVASGPKGWRCRAPRHYTRLKRWHRIARAHIDDYIE